MTPRVSFLWVAVLLCAAGCATSTSSRIGPGTAFDPGRAYLYGRFFINAPQRRDFGGKQSVGLVFQREGGSTYTFGSIETRDVQVLAVKPGRYWLMRVIYADEYGIPEGKAPVPPKEQRPLDFAAGRAYYLGDYFAKANWWLVTPTKERLEWLVNPTVGDHYAEITGEMRRTFPKLAALPTVDLPLFPRPQRKQDNGIGPSPGELPISPERVATIAPFIKRSYPTEAQCEAACTAGQCIPYRSESGTAIACVIRCDKDADCPQGLACNCPNREKPAGSGCQPIATAPGDPMARICLFASPPTPPEGSPASEPAVPSGAATVRPDQGERTR